MANPVWIGLEKLDRVAEQVKAGTWVQPTQMELPQVEPCSICLEQPLIVLNESTLTKVPMTDYESLLQGLEELKL